MKELRMEILLTGANGFVGSYFKDNYKNIYNINTFSFLNDSLKKLSLANINTIIHLSALVHQMNGAGKQEYERVNVIQTLDLAKKAKENRVEHFIFISTIAVYGIEIGFINKNSACSPITDYGKSKLKAENELKKLEDDNFKISIIRPPIVTGYNAPGNMKSLVSLVDRFPILPFYKIQNRRSMVYVGNLCHLIDEVITQKKIGIFLASDDEPLSITKLIELIANGLDKKVYFVKIPFFENLLKFVKPALHKRVYESLEIDNEKTKKVLEFENLYSTEDGIRFMIQGENR